MMAMFILFFSLVFLSLYRQEVSGGQLHKLCTDNYNYDACQQVEREQDMLCQSVVTKTDCILDAEQGWPTLSVITAEEAFLGAGLVTPTAVVIGEIVEENPPYQTAVIVRKGYLGGFDSLRGSKYCHPGYVHDELITKLVLEQLDWKALRLACNGSKTLTEQKFEALSQFFAMSCRPGRWTEDDVLDKRLKTEYSSLCELCGSDGCNINYKNPLNDTLTCLVENGGDVALTALKYADTFFSIGANAQNYQYLCPNGTLASSTNPCTWTNQLRRLILTSGPSANVMHTYIQNKLPNYVSSSGLSGSPAVEQYLALLLQLSRTDRINLFAPLPLHNYVSDRRHIPLVNESIQCGLTLRWSVTNDLEMQKCTWLQQASLTSGLQPVISCVSSSDNDTVSNLDNIRTEKADFAFADANFGYIAKQKHLINVAYPETDTRQLSIILMVVKNNTNWYSGLSSLKGKRICLPEYAGKEWLAFIDLLRTMGLTNDSCDYGGIFSDFVGPSCAPGANYKDLDIANTNSEKLCSNCYPADPTLPAKYCSADTGNKYYDSLGALTCLQEENGDYAVIALNDLPNNYLRRHADVLQQFRVIAKNGTLASYNGLEVDEEAALAIIVAGEVVARNGTEKINDIVLYLRDVEVQFGENLKKSFKIFDSFDHRKNLLFPDSTPGLTFGETPNKYIENFKTLLQKSETCSPPVSSSYKIFPAILTIFFMLSLAYSV